MLRIPEVVHFNRFEYLSSCKNRFKSLISTEILYIIQAVFFLFSINEDIAAECKYHYGLQIVSIETDTNYAEYQ